MSAQNETTNLVGKESTQPYWLRRIGLFLLFLLCEALIFIFGSYYFEVFPTNKNLTFNLAISTVFLAAALWFQVRPTFESTLACRICLFHRFRRFPILCALRRMGPRGA